MKRILVLLLTLGLVVNLSGCAKAPSEEINATKAAVEAAAAEGAAKYTPAEMKALNDQMAAVNEELKVQEGKFFKNYDKTKQMLTQAKADADALKVKVGQVKEEQKNAANAALTEAGAAVAEAKTAVENAPVGKGSLADIEAMKADVAGLEVALTEIQPLIDSGEYLAASEKATSIKDRALALSEEIKAVQEKMATMKGKKK